MEENYALLQSLSSKKLKGLDKTIADKVLQAQRITDDEALHLYETGDLPFLSILANTVRHRKNGKKTFFNRNFHMEPTNVCVYSCTFCSYSQKIKKRSEGWELDLGQMMHQIKAYDDKAVTEVHIVGGVMPQYDYKFYQDLFSAIRAHRPWNGNLFYPHLYPMR